MNQNKDNETNIKEHNLIKNVFLDTNIFSSAKFNYNSGNLCNFLENAKEQVYNSYQNDSICGTWEKLADMIYKGGAAALKKKGSQEIGKLKSEWAREISPYMNVDANNSPSFIYFRDKLRKYI